MNRTKTQLNAIKKPNLKNTIFNKFYVLYWFSLAFMLSISANAQSNNCTPADALQWDWMQALIASSDGIDLAAIHQFEYEGNTYFNTLNTNHRTEIYSLFFNCSGEQVCEYIYGRYNSDRCNFDFYYASYDFTTIWAYEDPIPTESCPETNPLQWVWIQNLIDAGSECGVGIIQQFEYNGGTYFSVGEEQNCKLAETTSYFYNCIGDTVCIEEMFDIPCDRDFSLATSNSTTIWTYEPPPITCPAGDPLQWAWMQELIATSSGCNLGAIHQFEYEGNTYYRTADKESLCFPSNHTYKFYNCLGEEICTDPYTGTSPGRATRCKEEVISASADFTVIWTFEDPFPNQACPPGEPLEWAWIQDLIAAGHPCVIGSINQFDYEGDTYYSVRYGSFCDTSYDSTLNYNCKGELVCRLVQIGSNCEQDFVRAGWNGTTIWAYQPPLSETCLEGDPLQWNWVQSVIANSNNIGDCPAREIRQIEYDNKNLFQIIYGEDCDLPRSFYDCGLNLICYDVPEIPLTTLCEQVYATADNYTTIWAYGEGPPCPNGDPLQWDWVQDFIDSFNPCSNLSTIRQFEFEGSTYITVNDRPCEGGRSYHYNCYGHRVCNNGFDGHSCEADFLSASFNYTTFWDAAVYGCTNETAINYNPDANLYDGSCEYEASCPEGDPLQWDWMQDLIAQSNSYNGCSVGNIRQFDFNGENYFVTTDGPYCISSDPSYQYYNCKGEQVCSRGFETYHNSCSGEFVSAANNNTIVWLYEPSPSETCPEGDPLEWDWIQDIIAIADGCARNEIRQYNYEGSDYYYTVPEQTGYFFCESGVSNDNPEYYYNCAGNFICFGGIGPPCDSPILNGRDNYTTIWVYEAPAETCPEGDPLQWDWIQDIIEQKAGCEAGKIMQHTYDEETYISITPLEGNFELSCPSVDLYKTRYYRCNGEYFCKVEDNVFNDPEVCKLPFLLNNLENSAVIWAYLPESCPEGDDPLQWDWIQDRIDNSEPCSDLGSIRQFEFEGNTFFGISDGPCVEDGGTGFYDCRGNQICAYGYGVNTCDSDFRSASYNSTPVWYYIYSYTDIPQVFQDYPWISLRFNPLWCSNYTITVYDTGTYNFVLIQRGNQSHLYYEDGTYYCTETPSYSCLDAYNLSNVVETWSCNNIPVGGCTNIEAINYNPGATEDDGSCEFENCPEGDPLEWDWMQDIMALEDECKAGTIRQFEYDETSYFHVLDGQYCLTADFKQYFYNCAGDTICDAVWTTSCDQEFLIEALWNGTTIWTYEPPIAKTCPDGLPEEWDWVQEMKDSINGCGETEIIDFVWRELTIIHFWNECDSVKNRFYDCQGNLICADGSVLPESFQSFYRVCDDLTDFVNEYTPAEPPSTESCPEGDPLEWDWIQELIEQKAGCEVGYINQFSYNGDEYIGIIPLEVSRTPLDEPTTNVGLSCPFDDAYEPKYYRCNGEYVCKYGLTADYGDPEKCDADFIQELSNSTLIWAYRSSLTLKCPENYTTSVCAPVAIPPSLTLQDFNSTDDPNYTNSMSLNIEEQTTVQQYFNTTIRVYTITDEYNNQKTCETKQHITNQFLQAPEVNQPGVVCEEDLWSYIKIGTDQYKIYTNDNGAKGEEISVCNTPNLVCSTADLGVDTNVSGQYNFWATTYFEFPDGSICESEASPFYVEVKPKPLAELSTQDKKVSIGEGIALMNLVIANKSGFWSGENIIYLMTESGENIAYFTTNTAGIYKLYYTVKNEYCQRSYLVLLKVGNTFAKPSTTLQALKIASLTFNMYPNPTTKNVFIDLPDEAVYQISLTNISGKVVKQFETKMNESIIELNVKDLPKGMYLVELKNESTQMLQKLIIE